jgi:hypothetical protein
LFARNASGDFFCHNNYNLIVNLQSKAEEATEGLVQHGIIVNSYKSAYK